MSNTPSLFGAQVGLPTYVVLAETSRLNYSANDLDFLWKTYL
jgi:hypothetical protein